MARNIEAVPVSTMIPGPQNHAFKLAFEKYLLWKMRKGHVQLP